MGQPTIRPNLVKDKFTSAQANTNIDLKNKQANYNVRSDFNLSIKGSNNTFLKKTNNNNL